MCGFVTIMTSPGQLVSSDVLQRMTAQLNHRGPDDVGYACAGLSGAPCRTWQDDLPGREALSGILFGHRRLSILDLTPAGHQPMLSDDRSCVLAYNGEVYNYLELRQQLEALGVSFRGRGDTEVLLHAYEQWGVATLRKLNGMWAFAIWDGRRQKLVVSRDRFGVKPLYYANVNGAWIFASEIKALLGFPGAYRGHDERKVSNFLTRCVAEDDSGTMFRGIRALPPATFIEFHPGAKADEAKAQRFWTLPSGVDPGGRSEQSLIAQFSDLMEDSVRLRVRSDVPIGTMLSGGLDSTSITLLIHDQRRHQPAGGMLESTGLQDFHHTFTACWPGSKVNEEADVDLLCGQLGLTSHKLYPTHETLAAALPKVVYSLDEPFETPTAILQYLLMKEASAQGVKVVLNGHGSDETLGGYPGYFIPPFLAGLLLGGRPFEFAREARAFGACGEWTRAGVARAMLSAMTPSAILPATRAVSHLLPRARRQNTIFQHPKKSMDHDIHSTTSAANARGTPPLQRALWQTFSRTILPMWLRMEDRVSMACSIESRLPFMDYRLVEFAFGLPARLKLRDGYTKFILRRAFWDRLPERIVRNRVKQRFATPYTAWFRGAWRPMIEDLLLSGNARVAPYLHMPLFREKLRAYLNGQNKDLNEPTLWRILNTELWLRAFGPASFSV